MKIYCIRFLSLLLTIFLLCGCAQKAESPGPATEQTVQELPSERRLLITAVLDKDASALIPASDLNGNFTEDIIYLGVTDVNIEMDGESIKLEHAIRDRKITTPEILAYARIDAKNGFCDETYTSKNGLTCFLYCYPDFDIHIIYDVYETPDGKLHLIEDLSVYGSGNHENSNHYFVDDESKYGYFIDREDWGLNFEVADATPTSITLNSTQSAGQQIGELQIDYYYNIYSVVDGQTMLVPSLQGTMTYTEETLPPPIADIKQDGSTRFTIDWTEKYGELDSGEYKIKLSVNDIFDESQVHPLMQDYFDRQSYWVEFTIPEA